MKKPDISVVILNFNTKELTEICIKKLIGSDVGSYSMEIIVCDNASTDGSEETIKKEFKNIIVIQNGKNVGFAAGNNPGIKIAKGRYILLLNSDTEVGPKALTTMIDFMDTHPHAGAATCRLVLPDNMMDPACHRGFPTPWAAASYMLGLERLFPTSRVFGEYHQGYKDVSVAHEVDSISGAFFMVRKEVIDEVGVLDEAYFMYAEDIDWAYRIKQAGWQIWFVPDVTVLHKKKQSGRAHMLRKRRVATEIYFHTYNWLFFKKYYASRNIIVTLLINTFYTTRLFLLKTFSV